MIEILEIQISLILTQFLIMIQIEIDQVETVMANIIRMVAEAETVVMVAEAAAILIMVEITIIMEYPTIILINLILIMT